MFEIFIVMPIYDKIRDFKRPKALNFEAIYLKKKEADFIKHCRTENVFVEELRIYRTGL